MARILLKSGRWLLLYGDYRRDGVPVYSSAYLLPAAGRSRRISYQVQLPPGSTLQQTSQVVAKVEDYYLTAEKDNVLSVFSTIGAGPGGNGQNVARLFVRLKDWEQRRSRSHLVCHHRSRHRSLQKIKEARVIASSPPAITGMGSSSGFDMELQDHGGIGHTELIAMRDRLLALADNNPALSRVRHNGLDDSPQLQIDVDQRKAQALGVSLDTINDTLTTAGAQPT